MNTSLESQGNQLLTQISDEHRPLVQLALELAAKAHTDQLRASGEPYISHVMAVANILADLRLDHETICAALLHDSVEDTPVTLEIIRQQLGDSIATMVDGVTKLNSLDDLHVSDDALAASEAESLRKMLLAMAQDVRVVLIKLADRLHNMRTVRHLSQERQKKLAQETMDLFAPLANRLGIWQVKWELEDLSFRILQPQTYKKLARQLERKRNERESMIAEAIDVISSKLKEQGMSADISGRPKHIYSIWRKMQRKGLPFEELFDVQAIRILVDDVTASYTALGIVHGQWKHIPREFDDYIANPKGNGYQSLHTAVIGPGGHALEVQIRTHEMHQYAEYGVAAHWRYKEQASHDDRMQHEINWLRQMLEWKDEERQAEDFIDRFKAEVFQERLYVLTPQGNIIDLPAGATPIDFAYHIHTQVGHRCRGARVNGKMVPLTHALSNGDKVEILTAKEGGPSRDWLNPHQAYIASARARSGIRQWFRQLDYDRNQQDGRQMLEKELQRVGLELADAKTLPPHFNFKSEDDLYAAVGRGEITSSQIINQLKPQILVQKIKPVPVVENLPGEGQDVIVAGVGKLLTEIATCCKPVPYEPIIGYTTRGSGVRIHRQDCVNVLNLSDEQRPRLIDAAWANQPDSRYTVAIRITAYDRAGLLNDITHVLAREGVNVRAVNTRTDEEDNTAHMQIVTEITNLDQLLQVLNRVAQIPSVLKAVRE
ncbi:MAG: bifunctional (p)ppGpp synthetase/guanosine-3',5'-bis(diphosphate) 3'-pyrophosphohydrolase [Gammaproteobacteria bacterium]|nr:bifunctional (p)ppGpp synthetase/guanosine-3',5'-bis(diphosphate) 3'-pyrophosphohydrolase [Gammaproteobacteria bacterium]